LECLNQIGSYICLCPSGFPMDEDERCQVTSAEEDSPPKTLRFNEGEEHGCPPGYTWNGRICEDIDECAFESPCQFECRNTPGGYQCECPEGYELEDGDCIDIDECADEPCTDDELCFNKLGSFECIATPCPPGYHLDISQCVANCANCSLAPIRIHMLSVPSDIKPGTSMLRLTAYDSQSRVLHRTRFHLKPSTKFFRRAPFALKDYILQNEGGRAVLQNMKALMPNSNHRLAIRSISKSPFTNVKYHSDFIVGPIPTKTLLDQIRLSDSLPGFFFNVFIDRLVDRLQRQRLHRLVDDVSHRHISLLALAYANYNNSLG
uniref:EGF-like domain-containing protein n=1 Tax=Toxocara canis TaxID=6265 RepID=A0A183UU64_TOXCA